MAYGQRGCDSIPVVNTTLGWFRDLSAKEKDRIALYTDLSGNTIPWPLIRLAIESEARLAVIPMQDLLSLGSETRFNTPGTREGNWQWRMDNGDATASMWIRARELNERGGRIVRMPEPV